MFIQTESTPNPATLKFLPGRDVMGQKPSQDFPDLTTAKKSPLASNLFEIEAVSGVFFGPDFVAVTKKGSEWQHLKPAVLGAIMDHFTSGAELLEAGADQEASSILEEDDEVVAQIKELLDTRVRPAVAQDGGDIVFSDFDASTGTVYLHMRGACAGCPSATMTLQSGIENLLRHYVPEVTRVEPALTA
jgi:NFU1 iron-sulfur cluster scaffold homolog, mitochondrial